MSSGGSSGRRGRGTLRVLALALAVPAATLAGCTSARNTLGTSSSPCFRALPVATEAVGDSGTLAGIRLVGPRELDRHMRLRQLLGARAGGGVTNVCVVSFHGRFRLDQVQRPLGAAPPGGTGQYAVVVVSTPQNRLLATFVLSRVPLPLRHEVLGPLGRAGPASAPD
ncbi:MAG: hypothetical protein ACYDD6_10650 [Acidimicrobiales bacterium]